MTKTHVSKDHTKVTYAVVIRLDAHICVLFLAGYMDSLFCESKGLVRWLYKLYFYLSSKAFSTLYECDGYVHLVMQRSGISSMTVHIILRTISCAKNMGHSISK